MGRTMATHALRLGALDAHGAARAQRLPGAGGGWLLNTCLEAMERGWVRATWVVQEIHV